MATLSSWLTRYQSIHPTSGGDSLRVVVALSQAPEVGISDLPTNPASRGEAMELLRASGLGGDILSSTSLRPRRIVAGVNTVTVEIPASQLQRLAASPGVEYVRPVRLHRMHLDVSVSLMGVDASVRSRYTGRGVRVGVIDSGIDATHPDFAGRVDLGCSRNFTTEGSPEDVTDRHGHGTHVAGIIGGAGAVFRGIAPEVEFIACKVFDATGQATEEGAIIEAVRWAIAQGADIINYSGGYAPVFQGTALLAPPWVWPDVLLEEEVEFQKAVEAGVVAVVSAGNEGYMGDYGTISLPATCPDVLSVAALSKEGKRSGFSSVGPALRSASVPVFEMVASLAPGLEPVRKIAKVDLIAPGGEVDAAAIAAGGCYYVGGIVSARSTALGSATPCVVESGYEKMSGTSQAAPHVAGMAALILEAARQKNLSWTTSDSARAVQNILREGCQPFPDISVEMQGAGLPVWDRIEAQL